MREFIPWAKPDFFGKEKEYVNDALDSTWISGGRYVTDLEGLFSNFLGKKHCFAVSNGTTAIHLAYLGLGLAAGDEIILPGFGFLAAANIALHMNVTPVFCEVEADTWNLSPEDVEKRISAKTKAIVLVHSYGNLCNMDAFMALSKKYNIPILEDCAESLFSKYDGKQCGTFGLINTFSFQATKTITTGEGGMVVTDNDEIARKMALFRSHGMDRNKAFYIHELHGHNFRLTNLQAAMGVAQFEVKDIIIGERVRVFNEYLKNLEGVSEIKFQKMTPNTEPLVWAVGLELQGESLINKRDDMIQELRKLNIESRPGFYASSLLEIYPKHQLPISENISRSIISLPFYATLRNEDITYICDKFKTLLNEI
jgi:perosamine synthetase